MKIGLQGEMKIGLQGDMQQRCGAGECFSLERAETPEQRTQGLMFRETLDKTHGMLFIFPQADIHAFWMKNTKIPLDIIRLDAGYRIVDIQEAEPCKQDPCQTYIPTNHASYVIELHQGTAKTLGLQPGDIFGPGE